MLTNSPNGECAWRLPTLLPLLGGEGRGEGELYPNCNDTASVRSNARNQVEHQNVLTPETDWTLLRTEVRAPASCAHFARDCVKAPSKYAGKPSPMVSRLVFPRTAAYTSLMSLPFYSRVWFHFRVFQVFLLFAARAVMAGTPVPLFDGKSLDGWIQIPTNSWAVKDGVMASMGAARGVIYTTNQYSHFRLMFTMRHVSGQPDHQACVLIFCTKPEEGKKPLDALGGIQFQPPKGGHWDYRPGHNNGGSGEFKTLTKPQFDPREWSRVEILVDAKSGTARMAVAQPVESKAVEVLDFNEPTAGKEGPIAWQMHNKGLFDEYKDVTVEVDPKENELISVGKK